MVKRIFSITAALAISFAIIVAFESVSGFLFQTPGIDPRNPKTVSDMMASMPLAAFIWLLIGYAVSSFAGGAVVTLLSGRHLIQPALIVGGVLTAGGIMNLIAIPYHPVWFIVVNLLSYVPCALLGYLLARKKPAAPAKPVGETKA